MGKGSLSYRIRTTRDMIDYFQDVRARYIKFHKLSFFFLNEWNEFLDSINERIYKKFEKKGYWMHWNTRNAAYHHPLVGIDRGYYGSLISYYKEGVFEYVNYKGEEDMYNKVNAIKDLLKISEKLKKQG